MKTIKILRIIAVLFFTGILSLNAQHVTRQTLAILNFDTQGINLNPAQMGNIVRLELEKLDTFEVMDRYDVAYMIDKHQLNIQNCFGKICLVETGKTINTDKMLTGTVEMYGEVIYMSIRLIDIKSEKIEKTTIREFLNLPNELQSMVRITLNEMFGKSNDNLLIERLTKKFTFENSTNNPNTNRLNLSGPRMGFTVFTGKTADRLREPKNNGGFDAYPVMFQFGYQFEIQYLNQGNFQALFEIIPLMTGLDQSLFIPSFTIMNGLRNNINGWEFAFGPTLSMNTKAEGYFDENKQWHRLQDWISEDPNPYKTESRLDSRGEMEVLTGFVFAFGKTFKSGKLNIPVNLYVIPHKDGFRFGASFGYNAKKN